MAKKFFLFCHIFSCLNHVNKFSGSINTKMCLFLYLAGCELAIIIFVFALAEPGNKPTRKSEYAKQTLLLFVCSLNNFFVLIFVFTLSVLSSESLYFSWEIPIYFSGILKKNRRELGLVIAHRAIFFSFSLR